MNAAKPDAIAPAKFLLWGGLYLLFVVYGSLAPLDFQPRPFADAWRSFLHLRYFQLGVASRADWVANILLYIPLAFLFHAAVAARRASPAGELVRSGGVFIACAVIAAAVEFVQIFFPPRTVSLNDLVAEWAGSAIGVALWRAGGAGVLGWLREMGRGGRFSLRAAAIAYAVVYLFLNLFPYDFFISAAELAGKLDSDAWGILLAGAACRAKAVCAAKVAAEALTVLPLGILLGMAPSRAGYGRALVTGLALGAAIEGAQFFMASGISQGASVAARSLGMAMGLALYRHAGMDKLRRCQPHFKTAVLVLIPPYLLALAAANGWSGNWGNGEMAARKLAQTHFLPLYYHYFTSEQAALRSVLGCFALYSPVGLGCWLWFFGGERVSRSAALPALLGALASAAMEAGKLFVRGAHPDPSNVFIAAIAAAAVFWAASRLVEWCVAGEGPPADVAPVVEEGRSDGAVFPLRLFLAALLLAGAGAALLHHPLGAALAPACALYAVVLWRHPAWGAPAVLAALPLLDFAPWSGWFFLDEFDLLVAITLALCLPRLPRDAFRNAFSGAAIWPAVLAASYAASALIGLLPLSPLDANAFSHYHSHYNSLRVLKGFAWAAALFPLFAHELERGGQKRILGGMLAGLAGVTAVVLWERWAFPGLFNFSADYRVTAMFSGIHTGGAYIEGYLVSVLPFAGIAILLVRDHWLRSAALLLFGGGTYALMVTYSRGGYAAFAAGLLLCAALWWNRKKTARQGALSAVLPLALLAVIAAVALPVLKGSYIQGRFSASGQDFAARSSLWKDALRMMEQDGRTVLFGMGLGRFPETFFWKSREGGNFSSFRYETEGANVFLRLGAGNPIYFEQFVALRPQRDYVLSFAARSQVAGAILTIPLCEKWLIYSLNCKWITTRLPEGDNVWRQYGHALNSGDVGQGRWYARRTVKLSLHNSGAGAIDVDDVKLLDGNGRDLVANGDFARGNDFWLFTSDLHLPWHIHNLAAQILFEQGWLGLAAMSLALAAALWRLARAAWRGDVLRGAALAAIAAFLLVGLFDSLFDSPRLATLFFLLIFWGLQSRTAARVV